MGRAVGETHRRYTNVINARGRWTGHLFQSRFASVAMDETHLMHAVRYVSLNPVRARLVTQPEDYSRQTPTRTLATCAGRKRPAGQLERRNLWLNWNISRGEGLRAALLEESARVTQQPNNTRQLNNWNCSDGEEAANRRDFALLLYDQFPGQKCTKPDTTVAPNHRPFGAHRRVVSADK